jgi:hypothetical protein
MKSLISIVFMTILVVSFVVAGFVFVTNSIITSVQEVEAWLEEKRSIHRVVSAAKILPSPKRHDLAIEIMVWDTQKRLEWFENKSMLENPIKQEEIARHRKMLSQERAKAMAILDHSSDKEIIQIIKTKAKERGPIWRKDLLKKLDI